MTATATTYAKNCTPQSLKIAGGVARTSKMNIANGIANPTDCLILFAIVIATIISLRTAVSANETDVVFLRARAIIVAIHQPVVSSQIGGLIQKIPVHEGEYFKKRDLLVAFDDALIQAQHDKTKAELEAAKVTLENKLKLAKLESIGTLAVSLAQAEVKSRIAEMKISDISLARCSIHAPFNGRVVTLFVNEYESVAANQKLIEIVSSDQLEIEIMAPSSWLPWLKPGVVFNVELDGLQDKVPAHVVAVGAIIDPVSKMVKVRGRFKNSSEILLPGMTTTVYFSAPQNRVE